MALEKPSTHDTRTPLLAQSYSFGNNTLVQNSVLLSRLLLSAEYEEYPEKDDNMKSNRSRPILSSIKVTFSAVKYIQTQESN